MKDRPRYLRVDPTGCTGHGLCAELFPEWVRLDDWGYPVVRAERVPEELLVHARRAVDACPTLALSLSRQPPRGTGFSSRLSLQPPAVPSPSIALQPAAMPPAGRRPPRG
ncbi:MAG: ferredoxin [Acidimicrobiales bacterium]